VQDDTSSLGAKTIVDWGSDKLPLFDFSAGTNVAPTIRQLLPIVQMVLNTDQTVAASSTIDVPFNATTTTDFGGGFTVSTTGVITVVEAGYYLIESQLTGIISNTIQYGYQRHVNVGTGLQIGKGSIMPLNFVTGFTSYTFLQNLVQLAANTQIRVTLYASGGTIRLESVSINSLMITRVG
jgi:hypothetical protein